MAERPWGFNSLLPHHNSNFGNAELEFDLIFLSRMSKADSATGSAVGGLGSRDQLEIGVDAVGDADDAVVPLDHGKVWIRQHF